MARRCHASSFVSCYVKNSGKFLPNENEIENFRTLKKQNNFQRITKRNLARSDRNYAYGPPKFATVAKYKMGCLKRFWCAIIVSCYCYILYIALYTFRTHTHIEMKTRNNHV